MREVASVGWGVQVRESLSVMSGPGREEEEGRSHSREQSQSRGLEDSWNCGGDERLEIFSDGWGRRQRALDLRSTFLGERQY